MIDNEDNDDHNRDNNYNCTIFIVTIFPIYEKSKPQLHLKSVGDALSSS